MSVSVRLSDGTSVTPADFLGTLGSGEIFTSLLPALDVLFHVPRTYTQFLSASEDLNKQGNFSDTELRNTYRTIIYMSHRKYLKAQEKRLLEPLSIESLGDLLQQEQESLLSLGR